MRIDRASAEADRLNDFWDRLVDGEAPAADTGYQPQAQDRQFEALVLYLESLMPHASPSSIEALDRAMAHHVAEDAPMTATIKRDRPSTVVTPPRSRLGIVVRAFDGLAAALLILILVSGLVLIGPARGLLDSEVPGRFASMLGMDDDDSTEQGIGSYSMTTLEVRPGEYGGSRVEVGLWEVILPPGQAISSAPTDNAPPLTFGFSVSSGAVVFMSNGEEQTVKTNGSVGDHPTLDYVRNASADAAHLLVLVPTPSTGTFPLSIEPWSLAGSPVPSRPTSDAAPVLISSVELNDDEAFQYRVIVSESVLAAGMGIGGPAWFGPPEARLHSVTVRDGRLRVEDKGPPAERQPSRQIGPGETVTDEDDVWSLDLSVVGTENATVLGLMTMPAADNHTLDQTVPSVAPFWGEWTVPESGEVTIAIRRLALQPKATYQLPTPAGVLYNVASGVVIVSSELARSSVPVESGGTVAQLPGDMLTFTNSSSNPVELIQTLAFSGPVEAATSRESLDRVAVEWLVQETERLSPGNVSLMLEVHRYNGENDGASSGQGPSLVLITPAEGEIAVRRDGGDAKLVTDVGESPITPVLGEPTEVGPGGYLLARPGAGWHVTGGRGEPSTALVLSISPDPGPGATPAATPAPGNIGTVTLMGDASSCDIAPLTGADIDTALATPSSQSPLSRSLRGADGDPANPLTYDAIVYRLQEYADCVASGDYARIYAFYSDRAVRESDVIQDLARSSHRVESGPSAQVSFEDLQVFPDGRAGARAVIDGEAAYLTFVYEEGAWKIDVWDDSDGGRVPLATPSS